MVDDFYVRYLIYDFTKFAYFLGIAILRMQKKPVNSLSLKTITAMNISLEKLEQDDRINGLIITSVSAFDVYQRINFDRICQV